MKSIILTSLLSAVVLLLATSLSTFGCVPVDESPSKCAKIPRQPSKTVAAAIAKPQPTAVKVAVVLPKGTSPADAIPVADAWQQIAPGAKVWYKIDIGNFNHVLDIWLDANRVGGVEFAVYSNYQADQGLSETMTPTGRGSNNRFYSNDLRWTGRAPRGGIWYVLVTNNTGSSQAYKVGTNITKMDQKSCHSYWEYLPSGEYVYWTACE